MRQLWLWAALLCAILLIWNLRAYAPALQPQTTFAQLRFLHKTLENGSAEAAQTSFKKAIFFTGVVRAWRRIPRRPTAQYPP
jgi:hypothetical protein